MTEKPRVCTFWLCRLLGHQPFWVDRIEYRPGTIQVAPIGRWVCRRTWDLT